MICNDHYHCHVDILEMNDCVFVITHDGVTLSRYAIRVVSEVSPVYSVARPRRPACLYICWWCRKTIPPNQTFAILEFCAELCVWWWNIFFISDMAKCKMYNKFRFYSIVVQRNIFHRSFELHLLHLDDERDLHRAPPRDVTMENLTLWRLVVTSMLSSSLIWQNAKWYLLH